MQATPAPPAIPEPPAAPAPPQPPSIPRAPPAPPQPPLSRFTSGRVVAWGANTDSQGKYAGQTDIPAEVLNGVTGVSAGNFHSLALLNTGRVVAWGLSTSGQTNVPAAALSSVKSIAAGGDFSLAVRADGILVAWGSNAYGQLDVPPAVQSNVNGVRGGCGHVLAQLENGTVVAWGWNAHNQTNVPEAARSNVSRMSAGCHHSLAVLSNGTVVAWGSTEFGQTDVPAAARSNVSRVEAGLYTSFATLRSGKIVVWGKDSELIMDLIRNITGVISVVAGDDQFLARFNNGSFMEWGLAPSSQGAAQPKSRTYALRTVLLAIGDLSRIVIGIAAGAKHFLVALQDIVQNKASPPPPPPPQPSATGGPSPSSSSHSVPVGAIVGGVVGGVAMLAVVAGGVVYIARRRRADAAALQPDSTKDGLSTQGTTGTNVKANRRSTATLSPPGFSGALSGTDGANAAAASAALSSNANPKRTVTPSQLLSNPADPTTAVPGIDYEAAVLSQVKIPWQSIEIGRVLGMGGFGTVSRGTWQGNAVAVKMLNVEHMSDTARDELRRETLMMCTLRHPCIASVYGLVDDDTHTALVMRFYPRGTLAAAMHKYEYMNLSESHRLQMALQVASGMCFLHGKGILHGDLKTSNLLVEDTAKGVVLADFGLSCLAGQAVTSGALTVSISPPEVLEQPTAPRTPAGDIYAFSIVLLEIFTGHMTYQGIKSQQVKHLVCDGRRPGIPATVPEGVTAVIKACWAQDAASRPTFAEVIELLEAALSAELDQDHNDNDNVHGDNVHTTRPAFTLADLTTTQI